MAKNSDMILETKLDSRRACNIDICRVMAFAKAKKQAIHRKQVFLRVNSGVMQIRIFPIGSNALTF